MKGELIFGKCSLLSLLVWGFFPQSLEVTGTSSFAVVY